MSTVFLSLVMAIGSGAWLFRMLQKQTGNGNSKSALIGAGIGGLVVFIVVFTIAHMLHS